MSSDRCEKKKHDTKIQLVHLPFGVLLIYRYMYIRVNSNDQTLFSRTLGIMVYFREIIPKWPRIVVAADDSNRGELMEYRTLANACASSKRISDVPWLRKLWKHKTGLWFQTFFSIIYEMSSFRLTNSYVSRWLLHHQPEKI